MGVRISRWNGMERLTKDNCRVVDVNATQRITVGVIGRTDRG